MDERREDRPTPCSRCGGDHAVEACASARGWSVVRGGSAPVTVEALRDVRLVREFKGPRVSDLVGLPAEETIFLPGELRRVERAIQAGDLADAERRLDDVVGRLLAGPRPPWWRRFAAGAWPPGWIFERPARLAFLAVWALAGLGVVLWALGLGR